MIPVWKVLVMCGSCLHIQGFFQGAADTEGRGQEAGGLTVLCAGSLTHYLSSRWAETVAEKSVFSTDDSADFASNPLGYKSDTMTHFNKGPAYGLSAEVKSKVSASVAFLLWLMFPSLSDFLCGC